MFQAHVAKNKRPKDVVLIIKFICTDCLKSLPKMSQTCINRTPFFEHVEEKASRKQT